MSFFGKVGGFLEGAVGLAALTYGTKGLYDNVGWDQDDEDFDFGNTSYTKPASAIFGGALLADAARRYKGMSFDEAFETTAYGLEQIDDLLEAYNQRQ